MFYRRVLGVLYRDPVLGAGDFNPSFPGRGYLWSDCVIVFTVHPRYIEDHLEYSNTVLPYIVSPIYIVAIPW